MNENQRLQALKDLEILDTPSEKRFDDLTALIKNICQTPYAAVSLIDHSRQWFKSSQQLLVCETNRDIAFCDHTIRQDDMLEVPDATLDERFRHNPLVTGAPFIRFYAGAPLITSDGFRVGSLCVLDTQPRRLNALQRQALYTLAREVVSQMEMRHQTIKLERQQDQLTWYQNLVESSGEMSMVTDEEGLIRHANRKLAHFLGTSDEALLGRSIYSFIHPDDADQARYVSSHATPGDQVDAYLNRWRHKEGSYRWMSWTGSFIDGLWYASGRDITDTLYWRERAEEEAKRSKHVLENISDAFISLDNKLQATYINQEAEKLLHSRRDQLVGAYLPAFLEGLSIPGLVDTVQDAFYNQKYTERSFQNVKDSKWIELRVYPETDGLLLFIRDVTEKRQAAEKIRKANHQLREAQQIAGIGVLEVDLNTQRLSFNAIFSLLMGYTESASLSVRALMRSVHPDDLHLVQEAIRKALRYHETIQQDFRIHRDIPGEGVRHLYAIFQQIPQADKQPRLRFVIQDITQRKENEMALVEARNHAVASQKAKERFLSVMSHEIRTPLNAIIGLTNLLLEEETRNENLESLRTLKFSADNLLNLINDVLDISKIEEGKLELESKPFDLQDLIENIGRSLSFKTDQRDIQLHWYYDPHLPKYFYGDASRLAQVLNNLVANAIKFTHEGAVRIRVQGVHVLGQADPRIRISIADTGIGIPQDKVAGIFDNYYQAHDQSSYGGTGLGLNISRKIVQLMGSDIEVQSQEGEGSTFWFDVDLEAVPQEQTSAPSAEQAPRTPLQGKNILLVEDNAANRLVARRYIERWGAHLSMAPTAQKGIQLIRKIDFDLILMDIHLPDGEGTELAQRWRSQEHLQAPILAMTASAGSGLNKTAQDYGMNGVIRKPFEPERLLHTMLQHLPHDAPTRYPSSPAPEVLPRSQEAESDTSGAGSLPIDCDGLRELVDGDPHFAEELSTTFRQSLQQLMEAFEQALAEDRWHETAELRHQYGPGLQMLGNERLLDLLEHSRALDPEQPHFRENAQTLLEELRLLVSQLDRCLEQWRQLEQDKLRAADSA